MQAHVCLVYSCNSMRNTHSNLEFIKSIEFIPLLSRCSCLNIQVFLTNFSYSFSWPGIWEAVVLPVSIPWVAFEHVTTCLWSISLSRRYFVQTWMRIMPVLTCFIAYLNPPRKMPGLYLEDATTNTIYTIYPTTKLVCSLKLIALYNKWHK
jgi:hypothetical protein